jgi:RimJ/RimL family protein N-acetyltransferase
LIQIKQQHAKVVWLVKCAVGAGGTSVMPEVAEYSVREHLRDDRPITIRALRSDDRAGMLAAIGRTSMQSLQRRFFVPKKGFSEREMAFFLDIDFESHVAIVAEIAEDGHTVIAGGGRYIVVQPGQAEIAFVVVDAYQGQGVGTILMRHLAVLARDAGLKELVAEVLPENTAMLKLFKKFGFRPDSKRSHQVVHLTLQLS